MILSENKESINDNEENLSNNIKSSDSDKNKILDKTRTRESSNLGISKREARENLLKQEI